jgi:hypothetical protein
MGKAKGLLVIGHSAIEVYLGFGTWILEFIKMDIILSKERVDAQDCDVLVTGFFRDERPLKGSSGWIDWRFNGMLSQLLMENKLTGDWKEATLIPSQERILPRMILLLGLGEVKRYSSLRLRELSPYLLDTLRKLGWLNVCLSFPYGDSYRMDCRKIVESLVEGMANDLGHRETSLEEGWTRRLRLFFAEGEEVFPEILSGVQAAKSIFGERIQIEISLPSESSHSQLTRVKT